MAFSTIEMWNCSARFLDEDYFLQSVPAETSFEIIRVWFRPEEFSFNESQIKFCTVES